MGVFGRFEEEDIALSSTCPKKKNNYLDVSST